MKFLKKRINNYGRTSIVFWMPMSTIIIFVVTRVSMKDEGTDWGIEFSFGQNYSTSFTHRLHKIIYIMLVSKRENEVVLSLSPISAAEDDKRNGEDNRESVTKSSPIKVKCHGHRVLEVADRLDWVLSSFTLMISRVNNHVMTRSVQQLCGIVMSCAAA